MFRRVLRLGSHTCLQAAAVKAEAARGCVTQMSAAAARKLRQPGHCLSHVPPVDKLVRHEDTRDFNYV